jgi:hypothetical protein
MDFFKKTIFLTFKTVFLLKLSNMVLFDGEFHFLS